MVVLNKVNNLPNFDFKGLNSLEDMKVYMTSKPSIPLPELRADYVVVKGRDSTYTISDGTYDDIEISFGLRTYRGELSYQDTLNKLNDWLRPDLYADFSELVFSEFPQWYFDVKGITPHTWNYNSATGEFVTTVKMRCAPFKYSHKQYDMVGNSSTPIPIEPRTFKPSAGSVWKIKTEPQLQNHSDLSRHGYQRVLKGDVTPQSELNKLSNIDGTSVTVDQAKYTSGNYHNCCPDFYSTLSNWNALKDSEIINLNSTEAMFNFKTSSSTITATLKGIQAGKRYLFNLGYNYGDDLQGLSLRVNSFSGTLVGSSNGLSTVSFIPTSSGDHLVTISSNRVKSIAVKRPWAVQENTNPAKYTPEGKSSMATVVVAVDMTPLLKTIEPSIYGSSTSEVDLKNILKARGVTLDVEKVVSHTSGTSVNLIQVEKDTAIHSLSVNPIGANETKKITTSLTSATFVDRLYYQNVQGSLSLWATFIITSIDSFNDPGMSLEDKYFSLDSFNITVKMNSIPSATKSIYNDGNLETLPYLKLYKAPNVSECKIDMWQAKQPNGYQYYSGITIKNMGQVGAGQHIEIDADYQDVIRYQENDPALSTNWNINTVIASENPKLGLGWTSIEVTGVSKLEIEWRTRRI